MAYDRRWLEEAGSKDSHTRALWALGRRLRDARGSRGCGGLPAGCSRWPCRPPAIYRSGLGGLQPLRLARLPAAFFPGTIGPRRCGLGWPNVSMRPGGTGPRTAVAVVRGAIDLCQRLAPACVAPLWPVAAPAGNDRGGARSTDWLLGLPTSPEGYFSPIGNRGFYRRGDVPAQFDQQPIKAQTTIAACPRAYRTTGNFAWRPPGVSHLPVVPGPERRGPGPV